MLAAKYDLAALAQSLVELPVGAAPVANSLWRVSNYGIENHIMGLAAWIVGLS